MAITLGSEVMLAMHADDERSYADVESALTEAGFESYTIMRNVNYDGSTDIQVYVRAPQAADGSTSGLAAGETLESLTTAIQALEAAASSDTPAEEPA